MKLKKQYNSLKVGLLTGLLFPLFFALLFFIFNVDRFGGTERLIRYITTIDITTKLLSLFILPDLLIFFYFNWQDFLNAARGVLMATFVYAGIIVYLKFA